MDGSTSQHRRARWAFTRSGTDRVLTGVAGGIAERLEVDSTVVRLAFVVLSFAGGFGVVLYLVGWLVGSDPSLGSEDLAQREGRHEPGRSGTLQVVSAGMVITGTLLLLREIGLWFGDAFVWPVALAAFGSAIIWSRSQESSRDRWARLASHLPQSPAEAITGWSKGRLAVGVFLIVAGMITFLAANTSLSALRNVAFSVLVTVAGLSLIVGPWMLQLIRQLALERRERIRSEERAELAAHLHDSVLQTLAMIQRAASPVEMTGLARQQERELRTWLHGRTPGASNGSVMLSDAVDEMAARIESLHRVAVETVVVGEAAMDERLRALVDATGEATNNAAKHSGAKVISVYTEVGTESVNVYVRDEGSGFDSSTLPAGRRGIAESIVGRMSRHGGSASVTSEPAEGTEVHLVMPRRAS